MTTNKLGRVTGQPCVLKNAAGATIGFARCSVQLDNYPMQLQGPGVVTQIMPNTTPTIYIFDIYNNNRDLLNQTQSIVTTLCTGENEYFQFDVTSLMQTSVGAAHFSFDLNSVVENSISLQTFNMLCNVQMPIDWGNIKIPHGGTTRDYAFEELCRELLLRSSRYSNFTFLPQGPDRGRDGTYDLIEEPFPHTSSKVKCILQCKYSNSITQNMIQTEIYKELVKSQQHMPQYYIVATNRNTTQDFVDWFNNLQNFNFRRILVQRQLIETIVRSHSDLWGKYFG